MNWHIQHGEKILQIERQSVQRLKTWYIRDTELASRMSELFWVEMCVLVQQYGIAPNEVLRSVYDLELNENKSGTKQPSLFRNPPLRGLWHKHYFTARFFPHNLLLGLGKHGMEKLVREIYNPAISPTFTRDMASELARRVTTEPYENRYHQDKLTGEWVVFAKHNNRNYYLSLCTHKMGDQMIFDNIMENCIKDFPDLPNWLS